MLKQLFCTHEYPIGSHSSKVIGACLSWGLAPVRYLEFSKKCAKCGAVKKSKGYIFGDKKLHPEFYGDDGWPVSETGQRLEIYED